MLSAVVDTNVIVAGILTAFSNSASHLLLNRLWKEEFLLVCSPAALLEIAEVLAHPEMQKIHRLRDAEIRAFCQALEIRSRMFVGTRPVSPTVTRDVTDTKWVALAIESVADYLVTFDRRHLHRLRKVGQTRIVTPHKFLQALDRET